MLIYLFLIAFFGLLAFAAIVLFIIGLIKTKKNMLMTAGCMLGVAIMGGAFSGWVYSKKLYAYVRSETFQEDVSKGAALAGKTGGSVISGISGGAAATLNDEAIAALANKSAAIMGKSIKTMSAAFDSTLASKNLFTDSSLAGAGIQPGRAEAYYQDEQQGLGIFITYTKAFKGQLKLTNYDNTGLKIDVAVLPVQVKSGAERTEKFHFENSDMGLSTYYILSKVE